MSFQGPEQIGWDEPAATPKQANASYVYGRPVEEPQRIRVRGANPQQAPWNLLISAGLYLAGVGYLAYLLITEITEITGAPVQPDFFWESVVLRTVVLLLIVALVVFLLLARPWARYGLSVVSVLGILLIIVNGFWPASLLGIAAVIALWLPRGHAWFGFR